MNNAFEQALKNFELRMGVSFYELSTSRKAQTLARKKLDKETEKLRKKFK